MKRFVFGYLWLTLEASIWVSGSTWKWPDQKEPSSSESKLRFIDSHRHNKYEMSSTTEHFKEAINTDGFYNRPEPNGRYPVHSAPNEPANHYKTDSKTKYHVVQHPVHESHDGTLDSLQYCRCTSTPDCVPSPEHMNACGAGKVLCCYKKTRKELLENFFAEDVDEEKATLLPGRDHPVGAFPPPPSTHNLFSPDRTHDMTIIGLADQKKRHKGQDEQEQTVIIGSEKNQNRLQPTQIRIGPTGYGGQSRGLNAFDKPYLSTRDHLRPEEQVATPISLGPHRPDSNGPNDAEGFPKELNEPLNVLGPIVEHQQIFLSKQQKQKNTFILNNNKIKKPFSHSSLNNLPIYNVPDPSHGVLFKEPGASESAQRPYTIDPRLLAARPRGVLVGPAGYTGIIGPTRHPGVLTGPGGPTGNIGPYGNGRPRYAGHIGLDRGVLVGPGGPTGRIGPNRGVLTGPGGLTGRIGPNRGILTGPGGPTGRIGPNRGILTGPGGPTGRIGPDRGILTGPGGSTGRVGPDRGVLTGPGGPTGRIGPDRGFLTGSGGPTGRIGPERDILTGPGGPTGRIGPERRVLSGPDGPTGRIGPNTGVLSRSGNPNDRIEQERDILTGPGGLTGRIGPNIGYEGELSGLRTGRSSSTMLEESIRPRRNDGDRYGLVNNYIETRRSHQIGNAHPTRQIKPSVDGN